MSTNLYFFQGLVIFIDNINARYIDLDFLVVNLLWLAFMAFALFTVRKDKLNKKLKEIDPNLKI